MWCVINSWGQFNTIINIYAIEIQVNMNVNCYLLLDWYKDYLYPRDFKVSVGKCYSRPKQIDFSVPQGSASGANIFSTYCSSLYNVLENDVEIQGFADDHSLRSSFKAGEHDQELNCIERLTNSFRNVNKWMDRMRLKLNPTQQRLSLLFSEPRFN